VDGVVVVVDAEQQQVGEICAAAVLPLADVVGVAAAYRGTAAGERAVPVAGLERRRSLGGTTRSVRPT